MRVNGVDEDPDWAKLDVDAVARFPRRIVITHGDAGPAWLPYVALGVADRIGRESRLIAGAGHSPHLTHPDAFAALIGELIGARGLRRAA